MCFFFSWFCLFSATKAVATTATVCFCNCFLKASSEKAVLIVEIIGAAPSNLCNHFTNLWTSWGRFPTPIRPASDRGHKAAAKRDVGTVVVIVISLVLGSQNSGCPQPHPVIGSALMQVAKPHPVLLKTGSQVKSGIMKVELASAGFKLHSTTTRCMNQASCIELAKCNFACHLSIPAKAQKGKLFPSHCPSMQGLNCPVTHSSSLQNKEGLGMH